MYTQQTSNWQQPRNIYIWTCVHTRIHINNHKWTEHWFVCTQYGDDDRSNVCECLCVYVRNVHRTDLKHSFNGNEIAYSLCYANCSKQRPLKMQMTCAPSVRPKNVRRRTDEADAAASAIIIAFINWNQPKCNRIPIVHNRCIYSPSLIHSLYITNLTDEWAKPILLAV